ncbi:RraA family protein [Chelatococcus composti]|jgi:4-hydroxy-4-methyl-2-oxoglutarate aldolase|uniref:Putative 4-hydroxy-4-methyl-2-oxoglutarate aldolase n=1 Tax=Chelatococcus composti TaxID=1743235 RepID=A0A841KBF2_9HYPH|nr:RraA family protein [Chelatococcus composti]MBB6169817.1 regulator of RNase E activity RraA [Chelatococcus composti]MBS7737228.1 RraA family protein [Chelatococcus composti]GGG50251.1 ribonuclease activity regulator RraA [Chelatococcus composti]
MSVSESAIARLKSVESGIVSDAMMRLGICGWMDGLYPVGGGQRRAVGRARTLLFGPKRGEGTWGKTLYATIAGLEPGDVLVFGTGGTPQNLLGDNVANFACLHGLAALVTDSTVRDSVGIAAVSMPVYARGTAVRIPLDMEPVALDVPIVCAGAQVRAGDVIVACEDGVLALPQSRIDDIIYQVDDIEPIEAAVQQAIAARAPLAEIEALIKRKKQRRD